MLAKLCSSIVLLRSLNQNSEFLISVHTALEGLFYCYGMTFRLVGSSICQLSNKWSQKPASSKAVATCLRMGNCHSYFFFIKVSCCIKKCCVFKHLLSSLTIHHALWRSCEAAIECNIFLSDEWGRKSALLSEMLIGTCQSCWQSSDSRQDFGGRARTVKNLTPFVVWFKSQRNCRHLVRWPYLSFTCSLLGFPGNITLHMSITSLKGRCERDDYHAANVHQKWGNIMDSTVVRFQDSLDTLIPYQAVADDTSHDRRQGKSQLSRTYNSPMDDASTLQLYRFCTYAK